MNSLPSRFRSLAPSADYVGLRFIEQRSELVSIRQDVPQPCQSTVDVGVMVTVADGGGIGYAGTSDLSNSGLKAALEQALEWAKLSRTRSLLAGECFRLPRARGSYRSEVTRQVPLSKAARLELLMRESRACKVNESIIDWATSLWTTHVHEILLTADGGEAQQELDFTVPALHVTAYASGLAQTRSWGGRNNGFCQQGGLEVLERAGFAGAGRRTAEQALELLNAPNCPTGTFDVILMPDQMMLQIHESIGHPLELDRILGDERNYAGTSFVTLDMFGSYRYGSTLLNVTHDPTSTSEFASFGFDDEGTLASREYLIKDGILQKALGGAVSAQRAGMPSMATARACSWNRPPIDRMSNLNLEPGAATLEDMIASVGDGLLLSTNVSWSIDDSRNKFQFGCEWGRRIRNGELAEVVRDPNYRGVSAIFWRSLSMVGNASSVEVLGTPFCGKGEPNQVIRVGHASPPCKFSGVSVFGAEH